MAESTRTNSVLGGKSKAKPKSKSKSSSKSKPKAKKADSVHVKRGASGGFIATHHSKAKADGSTDSQDHAVSDMSQLQSHLQDAMGDQPPQQAAPAPTTPDPSMGAQAAGAGVAAAPPQSTLGPGM